MTPHEVTRLRTVLMATYPSYQPTAEQDAAQEQIWTQLLAPLDYAAVQRNALRHVATSPFFPSLAELTRDIGVDDVPDPELAYAEVADQIRRVGRHGVPTWSHPVVGAAVQAVGWRTLCDTETPGVERAHFLRIYEALRQRAHTEAAVAPMMQALAVGVGRPLGPGRPR